MAVRTAVFLLTSLLSLSLVEASSVHALRHNHEHIVRSALPGKWYHDDAHPVHNLFRRGPDAAPSFSPIGSPSWSAGFPKGAPDPNQLPKPWVDALNAAVSAGKIPNIPQTTSKDFGIPQYPPGIDPNSPQVCSTSLRNCKNKDDIWDAPDGYLGTSFDDGPLPDQVTLNNFLAKNNEKTTYFMIGINMLANPQILQDTINQGHDIAVHTWTHPQMTTISNLDILGQLGWSVELIRNSTGGKIPRYWRPPTGDSDERVRAIAKEVFGLTAVLWNHSTEDWSLTQAGGTTPELIHSNFTSWLAGSKSPGMIVLEHVLTSGSVAAFIDAYPLIKSNGWKTGSVIKLVGDGSAFQAGASSVVANPATATHTPSTPSIVNVAPTQSQLTGTVQNLSPSTSVSTSAASPTESKSAGVSVFPPRLFGSAGVVVASYLAYLLL